MLDHNGGGKKRILKTFEWNSLYILDFPEHFFLFSKHSVVWTEW